jgi:hypothetical protein
VALACAHCVLPRCGRSGRTAASRSSDERLALLIVRSSLQKQQTARVRPFRSMRIAWA